ncbi:hypothetical protein F4859DRAFT_525725, partial [Xylaria cf. heliscus]
WLRTAPLHSPASSTVLSELPAKTASPIVYRCGLYANSISVKHISPHHRWQSLKIKFKRTVRVPDNTDKAILPPDLGNFPLFKTCDFTSKLPADMAAEGGVFFPMYQREAMGIRFTADSPFMIKVYAGGVNAVSGEHHLETVETKMRRLDLVSKDEIIQDYVVVPQQRWLDGFTVSPGVARQSVAMPLGLGYTVEAHLTGQQVAGGLQFEITPSLPKKRFIHPQLPNASIKIKTLTGTRRRIPFSASYTIEDIKETVQDVLRIPVNKQRLIFNGAQLDDRRTLSYYGIQKNSVLDLVLRLGGGSLCKPMGMAAGGKIRQVIYKDSNDPNIWASTSTITIPVHALTTTMFRHVTGREPPPCPISAATYAQAGLPFFDFPEEPSGISGAFDGIKSVNEINVNRGIASGAEPKVEPRVVTIGRDGGGTAKSYVNLDTIDDPEGLTNPDGPLRAFRTLKDLEDELRAEGESTVVRQPGA